MRTSVWILGLALAAVAQDARPKDGLVLVSQHVDLRINESLGFYTVQFKVSNPTDRALEGDVTFSTPTGAAVYEARLLKHVASTERTARLLAPDRAAGLYNAARNRPNPETDSIAEAVVAPSGGWKTATPRTPATPVRTPTVTAGPTPLPPNTSPMNAPARTNTNQAVPPINDPALLEWVSADRYRLRFFPVPARDTQTVTFRVAFESSKERHAHAAVVPLGLETNFRKTDASRISARLSLTSADAVKSVASSSHSLASVERDEDGHRFSAVVDGLADGRDLKLTYDLGFWSGGGTLKADEATALQAVRARRDVVSAQGSFLVIDKSEARDLARLAERELKPDAAPAAPTSDEDARECEFVRAAMKMAARSWAPRCEIRVVSTTDPARIRWAHDHGIVSGRSIGLLQGGSFEYVKHGSGCKVQEPNAEKLKQLAGSLK